MAIHRLLNIRAWKSVYGFPIWLPWPSDSELRAEENWRADVARLHAEFVALQNSIGSYLDSRSTSYDDKSTELTIGSTSPSNDEGARHDRRG